ncbi:hypothetical protein BC830DRAFT_1173987 [Chytriomyces sp. MP71]|nr:hypothetical protein BC830DRAFT_1173987 [Chytriomyces sp. MP71]
MSSPTHIVVVGLGMVGLRFCELVREREDADERLDSSSRAKITVFGEESHLAYNRVGLTQFFNHYSVDRLLLQKEDWYKENNITVHCSDPVVSIDKAAKTIVSRAGITVSYDYLVIATGSAAFVPPIPGVKDLDGVFVYRTVDDCQAITNYAHGKKNAAVIGGGLLGLEAAKVCVDLGLNTFVVDRNARVLNRQLDDEGSVFLRKELLKLGVKCYTNSNSALKSRVEGSGTASSLASPPGTPTGRGGSRAVLGEISLTDSVSGNTSSHNVDVLIVAAGIAPRDDICQSAGLPCHPRGGVLVNDLMQTGDPRIFAIGEVARHNDMVYGLVAPGYDMASIAVNVILNGTSKKFTGADMSTKLKLMGVHVASFGNYFAEESRATALTFRDPFAGIYKRLLFSHDGKKLIGGILVGDTADYSKLLALTKSHRPLQDEPATYLVGKTASHDGATDNSDLPDEAQVCSCNNITKGDIKATIKTKKCESLGALRACSKAGTGCGGCIPLVTDIFNAEMKAMGVKVKNDLCEHFEYSRRDLYEIVRVLKIRTFTDLLRSHGKGLLGCEVCKPCIASILASLWNDHVLDTPLAGLQDTNDRFLANIQRGGSYSVVPRIPGGEITPEKLIVLGEVAKKYALYTKITGGQRIDLFGAERHKLPQIWSDLVDAGFESGHAYGKSLRTVKSCVGSTWCRYGRRDSVGFAIAIEQRYKGIRSPHKLKGGVSGCLRECAEARGKDFGLIATDKGYNIYVCGNGGATPKHAVLLASDVPEHMTIKYLDRFLMFYIATADKLQRTARWLEKLEGGIDYLKGVVLEDRLGIAKELENQMNVLASSYFCEWTEVVKNPERWAQFQQFVNTDENMRNIEFVDERGQRRPADWKPDAPSETGAVAEPQVEEEPPTLFPWNEETMVWRDVGPVSAFVGGGGTVKIGDVQLAVFRISGEDGHEKWYATQNMCPHKRAFVLSSSIVGAQTVGANIVPKVACANHKKTFSLETGKLLSSDEPYAIATFQIRIAGDRVEVFVPAQSEFESVLGTRKWRVRRKKHGEIPVSAEPESEYKALWEDNRSRRGKYEGAISSTVGFNLSGDIADVIGGSGGGCDSGTCGDKGLEW